MKRGLPGLLDRLDTSLRVVVQPHDYPDHDAIASAFGLHTILSRAGYAVEIRVGVGIRSANLIETIQWLEIPVETSIADGNAEEAQIVIVDGYAGNLNVTDLPGREVAVIDHHQAPSAPPPDLLFTDIRPEYGACSTIIYEYCIEAGIRFDAEPRLATALLSGIMVDTAFMTRSVHPADLAAYTDLFLKSDWEKASRLIQTSLSVKDIPVFRQAMRECIIEDDACYVFLESPTRPETTGILADTMLRFREIHFVVIVFPHEGGKKISVRSDDESLPAAIITREALRGIGQGGGHIRMGGGDIPAATWPGAGDLQQRFRQAIASVRGIFGANRGAVHSDRAAINTPRAAIDTPRAAIDTKIQNKDTTK